MTVTNMIGLVLADDHRVFAEGLGVMLDAQDDLAVLGVAHDAHQAVELAATHEPMVLLLDAHMPGSDLASTLRAVRTTAIEYATVIKYSGTSGPNYLRRA